MPTTQGYLRAREVDPDTIAAVNELNAEIIEDGYRLVEELDKKQEPANPDPANNASHS